MYRAIIATLIVLSYTLPSYSDDKISPATDAVTALIKQLDAESYQDREAAVTALVKLGEAARLPLEAALRDKTARAELHLRAGEVIVQLEVARKRRDAVSLAAIIEQARLANQGKMDAEKLNAMLTQLVKVWSDVTGSPQALPVQLKDSAPEGAGLHDGRSSRNALIKLDAGQITSVHKSIVLAETAVDITSARDSIIIAGVRIEVTSASNCILIAGHDLSVSSGDRNSLLLAGGVLEGSFLNNSVFGAPRGTRVSSATNAISLNSPVGERRFAERDPARVPHMVMSEAISLEMPAYQSALDDVIQVTTVMRTRTEAIALFNRKKGDGEYVARQGQTLRFPDGKAIPELTGWKLIYCGSNYAVFKEEDRHAVLFTEPRR